MENKNSSKKKFNFYKFTTFLLFFIIILFIGIYLFSSYSNMKFNQGANYGQEQAANYILQNIEKQGYISINLGANQSLILVPSTLVSTAREQTILEIMNLVEKEGSVTLYNNKSQIVLVEYNN